tara:strand:+ start:569 stop:1441 length:873 start_codon:yes stop_codon:yes gene_type:complete
MSYYTHPAYQQQMQSYGSHGDTKAMNIWSHQAWPSIKAAQNNVKKGDLASLKRAKYETEQALNFMDDILALGVLDSSVHGYTSKSSIREKKAATQKFREDIISAIESAEAGESFQFTNQQLGISSSSSSSKGEPTNLSKISGAKVKDKAAFDSLAKEVGIAAQKETGNAYFSSNYLNKIPSVPAKAEKWPDIQQYASGFKFIKGEIKKAPKTQKALIAAASWFWNNVEKPAQPKSKSGSRGGGSSSKNPYSQPSVGLFALRPFFRKNNVWMYTTGALLIGGTVYYLYYRQ